MLARCGNAPVMQRKYRRDTEWNLSRDHRRSEANKHQQSARSHRNRLTRHQETAEEVFFIKWTEPINTKLLAWIRGLWKERLEPLYASAHLNITSQLAQRSPGQPGSHSTGCGHMLAGQEWTCYSVDILTNQKRVTVASGKPFNMDILVCPMIDTACSTHDLTTNNGIVIGCARHWECMILQATGGRTRMVMMNRM